MEQLAQKAIRAALQGSWNEAEKLNHQILKQNPRDTDALNRLARAFSELGKKQQARQIYKKVLRLDAYNTIAQRALERLKKTRLKGKRAKSHPVESSFLEEPGKTKTVTLIHLGSGEVVGSLDTGEPVSLIPHSHRVSVQTREGRYIGRFPDDLARRLIKLIRAGNEYKILVRSVEPGQVKIFIKEIKRAAQFANSPSFPSNEKQGYISFTPPDLVHEGKPETASLEEEED